MNSRTVRTRQERARRRHEVNLRVFEVFNVMAMMALSVALVAQFGYAQEHMLMGEEPSMSPVTEWIIAGVYVGTGLCICGLLSALWYALRSRRPRA